MDEDFYEVIRPATDGMPRALAIVRIGKCFYFKDDRLEEFRNIQNPSDIITFSDFEKLKFINDLLKFEKDC